MMKNKRYTQLKLKQELKQLKQEKELKEMTLQAAWDIVSDYIHSHKQGGHCAFVDSVTGETTDWGHIMLHTGGATDKILLKSTKKYRWEGSCE